MSRYIKKKTKSWCMSHIYGGQKDNFMALMPLQKVLEEVNHGTV